ncbi:WD repeat domain-containing protein [Sodiomyces alkalinus F11]|uniref:WD repeat domain-containing protein n=1 Tax=Sodiomyces alkalinus (strain CBS 110278 / VKM F-3762 / F11) TaxID=1314773 RepID=A0A3N2PMH0_SODAK|nr:WD repeat domain-containing protein [Sodiomyces alkalinus F11]ROT35718.1 WD repeat domain-containing protein [Sodiomyces alkalinus F11]
MRTDEEAQARWAETLRHIDSLSGLQRAVRYNGPSSPCVAGSRSTCWKIFLLFQDVQPSSWSRILAEARQDYAQHSECFLRFTRHPEELANVAIDPLADDPDSPWNTFRQDEMIRAEISQDVQRLPDSPLYHEEKIQTMIVDVLFVYCKLHPNAGGYRQGMHELLAPVVHVLHEDAVDRRSTTTDTQVDAILLDVFDSDYIEHDAFALFSKIMERAQVFYEVKDSITRSASASASRGQAETSAIVEKSKFIHEDCLARVDPELARHLKDVEVLPQIFLIRWIRLLFGREFPFDQLLVLWDTIFAIDPSLELIDLICVAMLIRIRWKLLEADYSVCLQLLLKYPPPDEHHGPHTFVDDAVYLKSHLDSSGGASLILKYTGTLPSAVASGSGSRPRTPSLRSQLSQQRLRVSRSPLSSPGRFIQQQGGVEAIFQGAAKNVLERGEKLGINQAVRDAMGEIKRNVQSLNESRHSPRAVRQVLAQDSVTRAVVALEKRNKLLAGMLDDSISSLKSLATSDLEDRAKTRQLVDVAAAKLQFVKIHLEDSTIDVPDIESLRAAEDEKTDTVMREAGDQRTQTNGDSEAEAAADVVSTVDLQERGAALRVPAVQTTTTTSPGSSIIGPMDISEERTPTTPAVETTDHGTDKTGDETLHRPPPIPTRSTLAQSSFSWMLEPDQTVSHPGVTSQIPSRSPVRLQKTINSAGQRTKRPGHGSRERNAFLFGEVTAESDGASEPSTNDMFGMETIAGKQKNKDYGLW